MESITYAVLNVYFLYKPLAKTKIETNTSFEDMLGRYLYVNIKKPSILLNLLSNVTTISVFTLIKQLLLSIIDSVNVHIYMLAFFVPAE